MFLIFYKTINISNWNIFYLCHVLYDFYVSSSIIWLSIKSILCIYLRLAYQNNYDSGRMRIFPQFIKHQTKKVGAIFLCPSFPKAYNFQLKNTTISTKQYFTLLDGSLSKRYLLSLWTYISWTYSKR